MVVHYEYSYSYNYNAETTLERAKMPPSDNITSPLNLLSHAASAVVDETQRTVSLSSSTSSSSSPSPPPSPPPVCNKPATISPTLQPDPSSNFAKIPDATATLYSVTNLPPTTITTTARSPHPQTSKQQEQQQHQPQTQTQSQAPSILAVFPQFSPSASTSTLPMPPGMKITLAHSNSNSNSRSYSSTAAPIDETEIGGDRNSMYHREPKGAIGTSRTATTTAAARGKAATFKPARGKQSRYTMKYHYVSMPRWEAHRYIESLARDSANASMYRHHGHCHPDHYGTWIPPSAVRRVILNTTAYGSGYSDASSAGDGGSGRFPRSSVNTAREKFQLCVSNGTKIDPFTRSLALSKRYR